MIELTDTRYGKKYCLDGEIIGSASGNELSLRPRWSEIEIYKSHTSGAFLVAKLGKSRVFHRAEGGCEKRGEPFGEIVSYDELYDDHIECPECQPEEDTEISNVRLETDFVDIIVCNTPKEVSMAMRLGSRIPTIAQMAYDRAEKQAPELKQYNPANGVII